MGYRIRPASLADRAVLVQQRLGMFADIGVPGGDTVADRFDAWLGEMMPTGTYRAWVVEAEDGRIVAGGGMTVLPWPPGPSYPGGRVAFVYNIYTEPAHRRRGLGRLVMETIHASCVDSGLTSILLNASTHGRALYEALGYAVTPSPMMFKGMFKGTVEEMSKGMDLPGNPPV